MNPLKEYLKSLRSYGNNCSDCGGKNEPYMINFHLWDQITRTEERRTFICLSCVEQRLGRLLFVNDFTNAPINYDPDGFNVPTYINLRHN